MDTCFYSLQAKKVEFFFKEIGVQRFPEDRIGRVFIGGGEAVLSCKVVLYGDDDGGDLASKVLAGGVEGLRHSAEKDETTCVEVDDDGFDEILRFPVQGLVWIV
ncbi:hypothetical protein AAC387_Pa04g2820 [Persea americana]